jgi:hypothetical protein
LTSTGIRGELSKQQFNQGRFANTVAPNDTDFVAALNGSTKVIDNELVSPAEAYVFYLGDNFSRALRVFNIKLRPVLPFATLCALLAHGLERSHSALVTGSTGFYPLSYPDLFLR